MAIIEHGSRPLPDPVDNRSVRSLVGSDDGAKSLTIKEMVLHPGSQGQLHTHSTDQAIMVMEGSLQMVVGDETRTVRSGFTLLAPPGVPHKLVNNTWVPARMLIIYPADELETRILE